jgi:biopolymer transport protein ExbD
MSRLRKHKKHNEEAELNVTAFLNLMVVLIPFLLLSAVFSQTAVLELNMPTPDKSQSKKDKPDEKKERVEIILRENKIQVSNGSVVVLSIDKAESGEYELASLSEYLRAAKLRQPEKLDSSILLEPEVEYERLVTIMDTLKVAVREDDNGELVRTELFPVVSIGDAPVMSGVAQ